MLPKSASKSKTYRESISPSSQISLCEGLLRAHYGQPLHGNKRNPLNELFYIILSAQTDKDKYGRAYQGLRRLCGPWRNLLHIPASSIRDTIGAAGLGRMRAQRIIDIAKHLQDTFGEVSLRFLRGMSCPEAESYLISLPGVGKKSARCVLMYSLGRQVFPVDTHVFRTLKRLGIHNLPPPVRRWEDHIQELIPERLRFSLHVTLISLGREFCQSRSARCGECPLLSICLQNISA